MTSAANGPTHNPDPNTWAGVIADLLEQYKWSQSELARRIGVSQQTISTWLAGSVDTPSIQTVHAVFTISGDSMLRLLSVAYGWPLTDIGQKATIDAIITDAALTPKLRRHLMRQYGYLLYVAKTVRGAGKTDVEDGPPWLDELPDDPPDLPSDDV
jgi:transcriptional regulator with XRE-family HTH domain